MATTTTLKLPPALRTRIAKIAKETGRSAHGYMLEALEQQTAREEKMREFVRATLAADRAIDKGGEVYRAEDVHAWLERLARGKKTPRPRPWRR